MRSLNFLSLLALTLFVTSCSNPNKQEDHTPPNSAPSKPKASQGCSSGRCGAAVPTTENAPVAQTPVTQ